MADSVVGDALEREHREIDAGLAEFRRLLGQGESRSEPLQDACRALRRHIFIEEEVLFPPLRAAGFFGPVTVMLMEHAEIWRILDELEPLVTSVGDHLVIELALASLSRVLHEHNMKEEQILYPQADQIPGVDVKREVLQLLEGGEMPTGWVCQRLAGGQ